MTSIRFQALPTEIVEALRAVAPDANGQPCERMPSSGGAMPCRHCLGFIAEGEEMLVLAHRPFPSPQPYAETGPIFLHAGPCPRYAAEEILPPMLESPDYIVRGYGSDNRIVYGTGAVTPTGRIAARAQDLLARQEIAYVHVRSARNNCYQCRIERG